MTTKELKKLTAVSYRSLYDIDRVAPMVTKEKCKERIVTLKDAFKQLIDGKTLKVGLYYFKMDENSLCIRKSPGKTWEHLGSETLGHGGCISNIPWQHAEEVSE